MKGHCATLSIGIFIVIMLMIIPVNAFAAQSTKLTLGGLHTNYDEGELIFFTGKLVGSDGYNIAGAKIWIMEDDTTTWQTITTTITDARGEFDVRVSAAFWDGSDSKVEIVAYYEGDYFYKSAKSVTKDMYIHQPRYVAPKIEQDRTITSVRDTSMSLQVIYGTSPETLRVFPTFTDDAGNSISTSKISIYVDGQYKQKVSSNDWSTSIWCGGGSHTVKAVSDQIVFGVNTYQSSSAIESFYCKPAQVITSTTKQKSEFENPLDRVTATYGRVQNAFDKSFEDHSVNDNLQIKTDLKNNQNREQSFAYVVTIKDEQGTVVFMETAKSTLSPKETTTAFVTWKPTKDGNYSVERSFWESVDNPTSISSPIKSSLKISELIEEVKRLENQKFCFLWWCW